jgi:hypothetical protein
MTNQAFALSPISARASVPGEEDYEAIREAFVETARGRWFLDEFARRNRNADTRMVLDAVSRIEETIAARRPAPPPPPEDKRPELLAAIQGAVSEAEHTVSTALDGLDLAESLVPIRNGARIISEISWRWREIGADGRICDLLDSQVGAIEAGCETIAGTDPRVALREAFDTIKAAISAFSDIAGAAPATAADEIAEATTGPELAMAEAADAAADEAEPYDEAMLELVAVEMAAPDFDDADTEFAVAVSEVHVGETTQAELVEAPQAPIAEAPDPIFAQQPAPPVAPEPEASLGATILANGLVTRPKIPANDPLAPIRRMTQAEKIAFFS